MLVQAEQTWEVLDDPRPPLAHRHPGQRRRGASHQARRHTAVRGLGQTARRSLGLAPCRYDLADAQSGIRREGPARHRASRPARSRGSVISLQAGEQLAVSGPAQRGSRNAKSCWPNRWATPSMSSCTRRSGTRPRDDPEEDRDSRDRQHSRERRIEKALRRMQRLAEAGKRGESPAALKPPTESERVASILSLGKLAPDFLVPDLLNGNSVHLRHWIGKPILLVFYNPNSASADDVLRFPQEGPGRQQRSGRRPRHGRLGRHEPPDEAASTGCG